MACDEDWQDCVDWDEPDGYTLLINLYRAHFYFQSQLIGDLGSELLETKRGNFKYSNEY